jgi:hypothetical protein
MVVGRKSQMSFNEVHALKPGSQIRNNCSDVGFTAANADDHNAPEMSALGQKRTYAVHQAMSALPPIATAKADSRNRSCPL